MVGVWWWVNGGWVAYVNIAFSLKIKLGNNDVTSGEYLSKQTNLNTKEIKSMSHPANSRCITVVESGDRISYSPALTFESLVSPHSPPPTRPGGSISKFLGGQRVV